MGVSLMICCVIFGTLLGWTRLASGSVWPAVPGHASINASAWAAYFFGRAGIEYDQARVTIAGWAGRILPLLFIAFLGSPIDRPSMRFGTLQTRAGARARGRRRAEHPDLTSTSAYSTMQND